jgi:hypothetical protein
MLMERNTPMPETMPHRVLEYIATQSEMLRGVMKQIAEGTPVPPVEVTQLEIAAAIDDLMGQLGEAEAAGPRTAQLTLVPVHLPVRMHFRLTMIEEQE